MCIKPGDRQVLGNVCRSTSEFKISWSPFWFDWQVLAAKIKIRLSIFAHGLQFASYGLQSFADANYYHCLLEVLSC